MSKGKTKIKTYESDEEKNRRKSFVRTFRECPLPDDQILSNLGLFLNSKILARILFMNHIFSQVVEVPGVVMEFGTRWGQNLALFSALRGIYDPFNRHRKIIGFDTFAGFPAVSSKDGKSEMMIKGGLALTNNYENYLAEILRFHELENPLSHLRKFELRKGNAPAELKKYLREFPETIISLAYFDFDLYEPTKKCLEIIKPRLVKGSVLGFDELNDRDSPGETLALDEVFGLNNIELRRLPITSRASYFVLK